MEQPKDSGSVEREPSVREVSDKYRSAAAHQDEVMERNRNYLFDPDKFPVVSNEEMNKAKEDTDKAFDALVNLKQRREESGTEAEERNIKT